MLDRLLDASLLGYTRLGYRARIAGPPTARMDDRTVVVTGATSGLGEATVRALVGLGANVVGVGRNADKARAVERALRAAYPHARLRFEIADLASVRETRALARRLRDAPPIHVLVNNAGVLENTRSLTEEGFERTYATNLLCPYVLTETLLPKLEASAPARVITVSSGGMYTARIDPSDLETERRAYDGPSAYARTKRGQVILSELWAERMRDRGVSVFSMHPGWAETPGVARSLPRFDAVMGPLLRTAAEGADTIVWLASDPDVPAQSGLFFHDRRPRPTHRAARTRESSADRALLLEVLERDARMDTNTRS